MLITEVATSPLAPSTGSPDPSPGVAGASSLAVLGAIRSYAGIFSVAKSGEVGSCKQ